MKQIYVLGAGILIGTMVGAAAVTALHAQSPSPVYLVLEIDVTNPEAYAKEYARQAQATVKAAGGRVIALGGPQGGGAKEVIALEGSAPKRVGILRWESMDAVRKWWNSPDFQAVREIGNKYAKFRTFAVEGVNLAP